MSEIEATLGEGWVELSFDEGLYPKDAVYGAAYVFIDRCYVHLDRKGDRQITVRLKGKPGVPLDGEALPGGAHQERRGHPLADRGDPPARSRRRRRPAWPR